MSDAQIESINDLVRDIKEAYLEEMNLGENETYSKNDSPLDSNTSISVRDLEFFKENSDEPSRLELLQSLRFLCYKMKEQKVFLEYVPSLELLFHSDASDKGDLPLITTLVDLMKETVENYDQDPSTECRFVTLMEMAISYSDDWKLSSDVERLWREFLSDSAYPAIDGSPDVFRKTAYDVLMSLPWLPSSPSLSNICSIEEGDDENVHAPSFAILQQVRSAPLPRTDCVHRLLNHLDDSKPTTIAISSPFSHDPESSSGGERGLGKTTLAAMVAAHPSVQSRYLVLWLNFDHDGREGEMTARQYTKYLDLLCDQLGLQHSWPEPLRVLEAPSLQKKREERRMFEVKRQMGQLLENEGKHVLLVLANVEDEQEIEWFSFLESQQSLLVTTSEHTLLFDWMLELDVLSEDEALQIFLAESEYPPNHFLRSSLEAKAIVKRCHYHPLTLRTAARWFQLKSATAGVVKGLEELDQALGTCVAKLRYTRYSDSNEHLLKEMMDLMLSPMTADGQPTTLMKLCLSSMAVVFRDRVPLDAVHLLWGQLLQSEPDAINELGENLSLNKLRKRVRFISNALTSLGLLHISDRDGEMYIEIHHELYVEYAIALAEGMQFRLSEKDTAQRWHEAFATAYLVKKFEDARDGTDDSCRVYAIDNLVFHMIQAKMVAKVVSLLKDDRFLQDRFSLKGWEQGTEMTLHECKELRRVMEDGNYDSDTEPREVIASLQMKLAAFLMDQTGVLHEENMIQLANAIHEIGFALAENGYLSEATAKYKGALKLVPRTNQVAAKILCSMSVINTKKNDYDKALKNLKACLKAIAEHGKLVVYQSQALQLKGDARVEKCEYKEAVESYDQALELLLNDCVENRMEMGVVLCRKGRLLRLMGDLDMATDALEEAIELKSEIGEISSDLSVAFSYLGDICVEKNQSKRAAECYAEAIRTLDASCDETGGPNANVLKAKLLYLGGNREQFESVYQQALKSIKDSLKDSPPIRVAYDLCCIGRIFMKEGDFLKALPLFQESVELTEEKPTCLERASSLLDLGTCHLERGENEKALVCFENSLELRHAKLGEGETVIETLEMIGRTFESIGKFEDSLGYCSRALELTEKVVGRDNEKVASLLMSVGLLKAKLKEDVEALALLTESLEMRRKHLPPNHPDIAVTLHQIAAIQEELGNYNEAHRCHAESLRIRQENFESDDLKLADSLHGMGVVARKRGDCERGLHFLLQALDIRTTMNDEACALDTLLEIGHLHRQSKDPESAAGCYEKCLEILQRRRTEDAESERASNIYLSLGHSMRDLRQIQLAFEYYNKALDLRGKLFGYEDAKTAAVYRSLGILEFQTRGSQENALEHLAEFVRVQKTRKGAPAVDYVIALLVIGDINKSFLKIDDARTAWSSALQAHDSNQEISKNHPHLRSILEDRLQSVVENAQNDGVFKRGSSLMRRLSMMSRLSDEISMGSFDTSERDSDEEALLNIFLDG